MKKGQDAREMLTRINDDVKNKRDYIIDVNSINVETNNYTYPSITVDHLQDREFILTDHSMSQMCNKLEIGKKF